VDGVSFTLGAGETVGLLGPNGAGKTTIISVLLGVLEPTEGTVHVADLDVVRQRSQAVELTNFAAVYAALPGNLTVAQNLHIFGMSYCVQDLSHRISEVLQRFDLEGFRHTKCGLLSSGEQTRVGLAKAFLTRPQLLLLDEPTASLDPATARDIRGHIRKFIADGQRGILWTTHNMHEAREVCDRVLFLSKGRILLEGDPRTLPAEHDKRDPRAPAVVCVRDVAGSAGRGPDPSPGGAGQHGAVSSLYRAGYHALRDSLQACAENRSHRSVQRGERELALEGGALRRGRHGRGTAGANFYSCRPDRRGAGVLPGGLALYRYRGHGDRWVRHGYPPLLSETSASVRRVLRAKNS
jgi:ABC-2 type transport system ATP-binding protein